MAEFTIAHNMFMAVIYHFDTYANVCLLCGYTYIVSGTRIVRTRDNRGRERDNRVSSMKVVAFVTISYIINTTI